MDRHSRVCTHIVAAFLFIAVPVSLRAQRIPVGTNIVVRNDTEISSGTTRTGRHWTGTLVHDLSVNGRVVARAGAPVRGRISDAESSGRMSRPGILALELTSVNNIPVTTDMYALDGEGHTRSNIRKVGGGAAVGAMLGGIFGGGRGAAVGAAAGGGAGTVGAAATRNEAVLRAESTMTFQVVP